MSRRSEVQRMEMDSIQVKPRQEPTLEERILHHYFSEKKTLKEIETLTGASYRKVRETVNDHKNGTHHQNT